MAHKLIVPLHEKRVCLGLHVEWSGAEGWRIEPYPRLRDVMGRPCKWLADVAYRLDEKGACHCDPSPFGRSTRALLERVTSGVPKPRERNRVRCSCAQAFSGARSGRCVNRLIRIHRLRSDALHHSIQRSKCKIRSSEALALQAGLHPAAATMLCGARPRRTMSCSKAGVPCNAS